MTTLPSKTRQAQASRAQAKADHCPPAGDQQVVLVLQGGGALGTIGAITAALIVGNAPAQRLERLHAFWDTVSHKGLSAIWPGLPGLPTLWSTLSAVSQGLPGFFAPNPLAWLSQHLPQDEEATGYYHTKALRDTLSALVDAQRLGSGAPRLTMGAVNVRSGEMHYFDSCDETLDLRHVLASGALPPAFPPVRIGDELFWDGGIYSNTSVEAVFDDHPRRSSLIFAVQLWQPAGQAPPSMWQVSGRQKEIQFASRVNSHVRRQAQIHQLRHIVRELTRELPAAAQARPDVQAMAGYGCGTVMHLMRMVAPRLPDEDHTKDMDFNTARIQARWQAGLSDGRRTIAQQAWLAPVGPMDGVLVHELAPTR